MRSRKGGYLAFVREERARGGDCPRFARSEQSTRGRWAHHACRCGFSKRFNARPDHAQVSEITVQAGAGFPREGIFAPSGSATLDRRQHRRLRVPFLNTRRPRRGDRHVGATQMSIGNYEHDYQSRPKWCGQACLSSILLLIALNIFVWGETAVNKYVPGFRNEQALAESAHVTVAKEVFIGNIPVDPKIFLMSAHRPTMDSHCPFDG